MCDTKKMSFFMWASHSFVGHVVLFQIMWTVPMLIISIVLNNADGTVTLLWALNSLALSSLSAFVIAILVWYTISRPLIRQRKKDP